MADDEAAARATRPAPLAAAPARLLSLASYFQEQDGLDELTEASNAVVDMVHAGHLDAAEQAAHDLLARFPDVHDGYDRLGMLLVAEPAGPPVAPASPGARQRQGIHACGAEPP